jgi:hypothetical protein
MKIKVQRKWYDIKNTWQQVTIADAQRLAAIEPPKEYLDFLQGNTDEMLPDAQRATLEWVGKILPILSGMTEEELNYLTPADRGLLLNSLLPIISGVYLQLPYDVQPLGVSPVISLGGDLYHLPTVRKVYNRDIYFTTLPFNTFSEIMEIQQASEDLIRNASLLCALVLRKFDDTPQISEDEKLKRAELFQQLSMYDFWQVFFSFFEELKQSLKYTELCLLRESERNLRNQLLLQLLKKYYFLPVVRLANLITSGWKKIHMKH